MPNELYLNFIHVKLIVTCVNLIVEKIVLLNNSKFNFREFSFGLNWIKEETALGKLCNKKWIPKFYKRWWIRWLFRIGFMYYIFVKWNLYPLIYICLKIKFWVKKYNYTKLVLFVRKRGECAEFGVKTA